MRFGVSRKFPAGGGSLITDHSLSVNSARNPVCLNANPGARELVFSDLEHPVRTAAESTVDSQRSNAEARHSLDPGERIVRFTATGYGPGRSNSGLDKAAHGP